jgi:hypothetical protein
MINDKANDIMKRAQDILSDANRSKKEAELMKEVNESVQNALISEQKEMRKRSALQKKQVISQHKELMLRSKKQRKETEQMIEDQKGQCHKSILFAEKKMHSLLKQLKKERVMWQVLSQEAECVLMLQLTKFIARSQIVLS